MITPSKLVEILRNGDFDILLAGGNANNHNLCGAFGNVYIKKKL
jgi:hypothetical protein